MLEDRLAALEARLRAAEDRLEIMGLLASYGPAVDSNEARAAAELWAEDGAYDVGGMHRAVGHDQIAALYEADLHRGLTRQGSGHVNTHPKITLHGDTAEAFAYSFVLLRGDEGWKVWRASTNVWTLKRTEDGWRVVERFNRSLDGSKESHDTLRRGVL